VGLANAIAVRGVLSSGSTQLLENDRMQSRRTGSIHMHGDRAGARSRTRRHSGPVSSALPIGSGSSTPLLTIHHFPPMQQLNMPPGTSWCTVLQHAACHLSRTSRDLIAAGDNFSSLVQRGHNENDAPASGGLGNRSIPSRHAHCPASTTIPDRPSSSRSHVRPS